MTIHNSILVRKNATQWLLDHLVLLVFYGLLNAKNVLLWHFVLVTTVTASVAYYLFNGTNFGLIDAYTFEAAMLMFAVLMPSPFKRDIKEMILIGCSVLLALYIGGSTGVGILTLYILGIIFYSKYNTLKILTVVFGLAALPIAHKYTRLLEDSGRFLNWAEYLNYWNSNFNMIFGTGIGSFKNISHLAGDRVNSFLYAHNDFLEMYLETGYVGIAIFAYLCTALLFYAHKVKQAHIVLMMFLFMANYFPNQVMLCKFMFVLSIFMIVQKTKQTA